MLLRDRSRDARLELEMDDPLEVSAGLHVPAHHERLGREALRVPESLDGQGVVGRPSGAESCAESRAGGVVIDQVRNPSRRHGPLQFTHPRFAPGPKRYAHPVSANIGKWKPSRHLERRFASCAANVAGCTSRGSIFRPPGRRAAFAAARCATQCSTKTAYASSPIRCTNSPLLEI